MREILFRGKLIDGGEWVEGDLLRAEDYFNGEERSYIFVDSTDYHRGGFTGRNEVLPETVGQYTGLNDMNDKRIFEGDIVRCKHVYEDYNGTFEDAKIRRAYGKAFDENTGECIYMRNYAVRMNNGSWELRNGSDAHKINSNYIINHDVGIIGNIHDNSELLEVSK